MVNGEDVMEVLVQGAAAVYALLIDSDKPKRDGDDACDISRHGIHTLAEMVDDIENGHGDEGEQKDEEQSGNGEDAASDGGSQSTQDEDEDADVGSEGAVDDDECSDDE